MPSISTIASGGSVRATVGARSFSRLPQSASRVLDRGLGFRGFGQARYSTMQLVQWIYLPLCATFDIESRGPNPFAELGAGGSASEYFANMSAKRERDVVGDNGTSGQTSQVEASEGRN